MQLKIKKTYPILIGDMKTVTITLIGCGGTGSFLALHLARLAWHAAAAGLEIQLKFIDPDRVEEKNIGRQNFCPAEIGEYKAYTLARRFGLALGVSITAITEKFNQEQVGWYLRSGNISILCGCVDGPDPRREIALIFRHTQNPSRWWIDGGNHHASGQVYIGNNTDPLPTISPLGFCSHLPHPGIQAPDLLAPPSLPLGGNEGGQSCADLLAANAQSLMINQAIAGWMATYCYRLLISRDLDLMATYINLDAGSVRSVPITKGISDEEEE